MSHGCDGPGHNGQQTPVVLLLVLLLVLQGAPARVDWSLKVRRRETALRQSLLLPDHRSLPLR